MNDEFGLPPVQAQSQEDTEQQRLDRLRAQAAAMVAKENDAATLLRFVAEERAKMAPVSPEGQGFPQDYDKISINLGNQKTDLSYVPLGVNGYVIKVPRGEEVILPHIYVKGCLEDAVEEVTIQSMNGYITRPALRFQYSFRGKATTDEYKAFLAKQKEKAERDVARAA